MRKQLMLAMSSVKRLFKYLKQPSINIIKMPEYRYISRWATAVNIAYDDYNETLSPEIKYGRILFKNEGELQGLLDLRGNVVLPCQYDETDHYTDRFIKISRPRKGGKSRRHRNKQGKRKVRLTSKDLGKPLMDALRAYAALCPLLDYSEVQSISDALINQLHRELAAITVISHGQAMPEHTPWQLEEAETQIVWHGDYHHG